jgi:hypothetical protein
MANDNEKTQTLDGGYNRSIIPDFHGVDPVSIIPAAKGVETSLHTCLMCTRKLFLLSLALVVLPLVGQTGLSVDPHWVA